MTANEQTQQVTHHSATARHASAGLFEAAFELVADARDGGFTLFPRALYDPAYGDASAEAIYNNLPAPEPDPADAADPSSAGGTTPPPETGSTPPGSSTPPPPGPPPAGDPAAPVDVAQAVGEVRDLPLPTPPTPGQLEDLAQHGVLITALAQQARAHGKDSAVEEVAAQGFSDSRRPGKGRPQAKRAVAATRWAGVSGWHGRRSAGSAVCACWNAATRRQRLPVFDLGLKLVRASRDLPVKRPARDRILIGAASDSPRLRSTSV